MAHQGGAPRIPRKKGKGNLKDICTKISRVAASRCHRVLLWAEKKGCPWVSDVLQRRSATSLGIDKGKGKRVSR